MGPELHGFSYQNHGPSYSALGLFFLQPRHPVVRVYVSSTYTDMMLEKNVLVTEVYPRLKELCRERYGLEFQVRFKSCSY